MSFNVFLSLSFHGYGFKDCNSQIHVVFGGCKWWHFFPQDTLEQHIEKFREVNSSRGKK